MRRPLLVACLFWLHPVLPAHADDTPQPAARSSKAPIVWTIVGAGAGFGVGLWAGLTAFDDAINSDRKVWTSALVGAAIGGVAGHVLGRSRASGSPDRVQGGGPFEDPRVRWTIPASAPPFGSGTFAAWARRLPPS